MPCQAASGLQAPRSPPGRGRRRRQAARETRGFPLVPISVIPRGSPPITAERPATHETVFTGLANRPRTRPLRRYVKKAGTQNGTPTKWKQRYLVTADLPGTAGRPESRGAGGGQARPLASGGGCLLDPVQRFPPPTSPGLQRQAVSLLAPQNEHETGLRGVKPGVPARTHLGGERTRPRPPAASSPHLLPSPRPRPRPLAEASGRDSTGTLPSSTARECGCPAPQVTTNGVSLTPCLS